MPGGPEQDNPTPQSPGEPEGAQGTGMENARPKGDFRKAKLPWFFSNLHEPWASATVTRTTHSRDATEVYALSVQRGLLAPDFLL